jgi:broad specificity phosphatase PhoE
VIAQLTEVVFETHSWSEDSDAGIASGWNDTPLSRRGRALATELGQRRRADGTSIVLASDLRRAAQTAEIAFEGCSIPVLLDWRLRECNYGLRNGTPAESLVADRHRFLTTAYPGGESWTQAVARCALVLDDIVRFWPGQRVLVIGHVATRWAFEHQVHGHSIEALASQDFAWRPGWEYVLG